MASDPRRRARRRARVGAVAMATAILYAGSTLTRSTSDDPPAGSGSSSPSPSSPSSLSAPLASSASPGPPRVAASAKPRGAPRRTAEPAASARAAVTTLLEQRSAAVLARDRAAYADILDPKAGTFRAEQLAIFANLAPVPLATWSYVVDEPGDDPITDEIRHRHDADEVYAPSVGLRYRLDGFDSEPTELTQRVTFVRRGARWYLASDSDFDREGHATARDLWDFEAVDVVRTAHSLVIGPRGRRAYLESVASDSDAAIPRVTAMWGKGWSQRVVVLVPTSQRQVSDLIGTGTALSQIAAVAVSQVAGSGGAYRAVGSRVIVNPPNFDQLTPLGRRVVLTHEVTHVASRDATGPNAPAWLVEGFADYVGYRGTAVEPKTAARELGIDVREKRAPKELPGEDDFHGDSKRLAQSYEGAWLACRMIAEQHGEAKLLAFYRAVGSSDSGGKDAAVRAAFATVLKTTPQAFTAAWRAYVQETLA